MHIKELNATFGRLENETLSLSSGLNVIHAPNEGGKSTWTTFLRVMLYGLNTRDRSPNAEKRRYMPWSGSAMQGRMDLSAAAGDLTIIRRTQRVNSPMGAFSAVYAGTATPVDTLTAANCGESLIGVPQEIFEHSAFIRQSGIAVDHNAALEKRIASLITTGEEDTSYTDAADRLRKQLNYRQSNRTTGQIPQLSQSITSMQGTLAELAELENLLQSDIHSQQNLQQRQQDILQQLELHKKADWAQAAAQANTARNTFHRAQSQVEALEAQTAGLPEKDELDAIRSAILSLEPVDAALADARQQTEDADLLMKQAQSLLEAHPFAGHTPEAAGLLPLDLPPKPKFSLLLLLLAIALFAGIAFGLNYVTNQLPIALGCGAGAAGLVLLVHLLLLGNQKKQWSEQEAQLTKQHQEAAEAYTLLYNEAARAREAHQTALAALQALTASRETNWESILHRINAFCPNAEDTADVLKAVENALRRRADLEAARRTADDARIRWELVADQATDGEVPSVQRPLMSRQQLESIHSDIHRKLTELQRQIHTTQGRIQAVADPQQLRSQLELTQQKRDQLQLEYDAIELASQVLTQANTSLQNRFSPALGEKSAKIFTKLTKGKYNKVVLSKDMVPSAQEFGQMLPHEAAVLSQGAADQLYLAVRLAICQLVLPPEDPAPILLDDALVTFDDDRMAATLDYLVELAVDRQILLFTCQHRELDYLAQAHPEKYHAIQLNQ